MNRGELHPCNFSVNLNLFQVKHLKNLEREMED